MSPRHRLLHVVACLSGLATLTVALQAQQQVAELGVIPAQLPTFEVATVKPTLPEQRIVGLFTYPGGRLVCNGCTLQYLLLEAFQIQPFQLEGGPSWLTRDRFEVEAKPSETAASGTSRPGSPKDPPNAEQRLMLQALLSDRFHLNVHHQTVHGKVYRLTAVRPKLQPPTDPHAFPWAGSIAGGPPGSDGLRGTNITMDQLASRISNWLNRPVLNQTSLHGSFDFETKTGSADDNGATAQDTEAAIIYSVHALGLNLQSASGPVDGLVVDHAEQPSPN